MARALKPLRLAAFAASIVPAMLARQLLGLLIVSGVASSPAHAQCPPREIVKLTSSDAAHSQIFGWALALDGDTFVAGAFHDDEAGANAGAAYVFTRNLGAANAWGQVKKLFASDPQSDSDFGRCAALDGDTALIGSTRHDGPAPDAGAAYVFERNFGGANQWGEVKLLLASDAAMSTDFGVSVAISGDTAAVGAGNGNYGGAVYVFERNSGGPQAWGEVKKLAPTDTVPVERFGWSVAIDRDTLLVGARVDDGHGSIYFFERNAGGANNWGQVRKLTASDIQNGDEFGYSVAISGDTALAGSPFDDDNGPQSGSAYVLARNLGGANNWGEVRKLKQSSGVPNDHPWFGIDVELDGDTALISAPQSSEHGLQTGSAFVYERNQGAAGAWGLVTKLMASDATMGDDFGGAIALSGETLVCGEPYDHVGSTQPGSVVVFDGPIAPAPYTYCTAATTTHGCAATLASSGVASASATSGFAIELTHAEGRRTSALYYGIGGPASTPWGGGFMCIAGARQRCGQLDSGGHEGQCDGAVSVDWRAFLANNPAALGNPLTAGLEVWAQALVRDPQSATTTSSSNALAFTVCL